MEVEIFSWEECNACEKMISLLRENEKKEGEDYRKHDIFNDEVAMKKLKEKIDISEGDSINLPVWCVEDVCYKGYSKEKVEKVLDF